MGSLAAWFSPWTASTLVPDTSSPRSAVRLNSSGTRLSAPLRAVVAAAFQVNTAGALARATNVPLSQATNPSL